MKTFIRELVFGKNALVSGAIALAVVGSLVLGCDCGKKFDLANLANDSNSSSPSNTSRTSSSSDAIPSNDVVEGLVKDTMQKFAAAVDSGDFTDLYEDASTDFQSTYSVSEVKEQFKSYTDKKSLVVPILKKVDAAKAEFTTPVGIRTEKGLSILMANGKFPTKPYNVRFEYEYVQRGGEWNLLKLVINIP